MPSPAADHHNSESHALLSSESELTDTCTSHSINPLQGSVDGNGHSLAVSYIPIWRSRLTNPGQGVFVKYLFYLSCISTLFTTTLVLYSFSSGKATLALGDDPVALRRPSQYVNLERLWRPDQKFPPIQNFPDLVFQLDKAGQLREDDMGWASQLGAVYPHDRHIRVNSEITTVAHFRHLDFGMEACVIRYMPSAAWGSTSTRWGILDIRLVDPPLGPEVVFPAKWSHAKQSRSIGSFNASSESGSGSSFPFHCPSNEYTTLQLKCSSETPNCDVDFWQTKLSKPPSGIVMVQYSALGKLPEAETSPE